MNKRLKLLIAGLVTSAVAVLAVPLVAYAVAGPSCTVGATGSDYTTIQAAVNDTNCTTIKVKAGTYNENVTISRSLTLKGAKSGVDVDGRTFAVANESTISGAGAVDAPAITVNAPGVTINGFSVTDPNHGTAVTIKTAGNDVVFKNNIVDTVGGVSYSPNATGVYLEYGPDNVKVTGNRITNIQSVPTAQGILIGDSTSTNPSLDIIVDSNTVSNVKSTRGAYGIQANNGAKATGYTELKARGNTIKDLTGGWVHAIGLEGKTPNAVVRYNVISGLNAAGADKVAVWFEDNPFFFTVAVNRNSLNVGSTAAGVAVAGPLVTQYPSLTVDAECNWWGASNGAGAVASGSGSLIGPGVDSSPWLKSANLDSKCGDKDKNHKDDNHHGNEDCKDDDKRNTRYND